MTQHPNGNLDLTGWLCTHLPQLSAAANEYGWGHKLDAALTSIRNGIPIAQALARHRLPIDLNAARGEQDRISRGDPAVLAGLGIDPVTVTGSYVCPDSPMCPRRAQPDTDGHEPRCGIHAKTMILRIR